MPKHLDIKRSRDYWNFLNAIAESQEKGGPFDQSVSKVFADFLQENGDARHILARAAIGHSHHRPDSGEAALDHPALPPREPFHTIEEVQHPLQFVGGMGDWPVDSHKEGVLSRVRLYRQATADNSRSAPVLHWQAHIPKTVSTRWERAVPDMTGNGDQILRSRTANLVAPVTVEELHQFIDAMPNSSTKLRWRSAAERHGWKNPNASLPKAGQETPEMTAMLGPKVRKLARSDISPLTHAAGSVVNWQWDRPRGDVTPMRALADAHAEEGLPGQHLLRAGADHIHSGTPIGNVHGTIRNTPPVPMREPNADGGYIDPTPTEQSWMDHVNEHGHDMWWENPDDGWQPYSRAETHVPLTDRSRLEITPVHSDGPHPHLLSVSHEHVGGHAGTRALTRYQGDDLHYYVPVTSHAHLQQLLADLPKEHSRAIHKAFGTSLPARDLPRKLAREDKKAIGARIKALIKGGMDRKKAVKQALKECRVKLARAGTETEQHLLATIAQQPHEDTPWLVYADHLDESDRPAEAARVRWWIGARQHMNSQPVPTGAVGADSASHAQRLANATHTLPQWIQRALSADIAMRRHADKPLMQEAAMLRLKVAFGLAHPEDFAAARGKAAGAQHENYQMAYRMLTANPHTSLYETNKHWAAPDENGDRSWPLVVTEPVFAHTRQHDYQHHHQVFHEEATRAEALVQHMHDNPPPTELPAKLKLARMHASALQGLGSATRQSMSNSHDARLDLARKIVHEAGLSPASVRAAIAATGRQTRPSAVIAVQNSVSPEHAAYAAAWYGMLAGEPAMTVFHPGEGQHMLHIMDTPHPTDHVVNFLTKAGVPSFTVERRGPGSRVYAVSTDQSFDPWQLARGLDARHSRIAGQATRVGGGSDTAPDPSAAARAAYRDTIRATERRAFASSAEPDTGPAS